MTSKFKYIYVPADVEEPLQELEMEIPEGKEVECLLDHLKNHFAAKSGPKTDEQRKSQKENLLRQLGDGASKVDASLLEAATNMNMVENIALLANSPDYGFVGVNMYCDDEAVSKGLPLNPRAANLAQCCGRLMEVRGDVFLARVFDNEDSFQRMDLTMNEVSSSAKWVRDASQQAAKRARSSDSAEIMERINERNRQKAAAPVVRELSAAEVEKDKGNAAVKEGNWAAATQHYTAALQLDPQLTVALNNRSLANFKLGLYEASEQDASEVLAREPRNVKALLRRASAREALKKLTEAESDYRSVLEIEPKNKVATESLLGLAVVAV